GRAASLSALSLSPGWAFAFSFVLGAARLRLLRAGPQPRLPTTNQSVTSGGSLRSAPALFRGRAASLERCPLSPFVVVVFILSSARFACLRLSLRAARGAPTPLALVFGSNWV